CLLIRHLSHGEDSRLNRCPGSVDHYREAEDNKMKRDAWEEYKNDVQPLRAEVERDIQARLQFHSLDRKE
ncbi:hypothetical protein, partial [Pseudomonas aeruginosa]|uniref:hypothetical protein n=1 Tax=Pseudomonas aeruginosa TaxID=287 RepID=UPI0019697FCB